MADFDVVNVANFLNLQVTSYDKDNNLLPDDGEYQRQAAETQYVFAEFLRDKDLLLAGVDVSRRPDLTVKFSQLTDAGKAFSRFALHKWMSALDRRKSGAVDAKGLEKYWQKFTAT